MRPVLTRGSFAAALTVAALTLTACGDDPAAPARDDIAGNSTDRAFVVRMVPHHQAAVEMAAIARKRAEHKPIKRLADAIIASQSAEIEQLPRLDRRLERAGVEPGELGTADDTMSGDMDSAALKAAEPFDRAFIDTMIGHHQGAIRMAQAELQTGDNPELRRLATAIARAQGKEIDQMNMWRVGWYGAISPAGGVPLDDGEGTSPHHGG